MKRPTWSRLVSSPLRATPAFVVIGEMKAGTSSLFNYLCQHPQIAEPFQKEAQFFERWKPMLVYRSYFPLRSQLKGQLTGEASPGYLWHPTAVQRLSRKLPDARLIALLREPAERAYSHWRHNRLRKTEPLNFKDAIDAEWERIGSGLDRVWSSPTYAALDAIRFSYVERGYYARHLLRLFRYVDRERVLVLRAEEMFDDPQGVLSRCFAHIGVSNYAVPDLSPTHVGKRKEEHPEVMDALREHFRLPNERLYRLLETTTWWDYDAVESAA